ncbi:ABC transporter ATP-binding protein [Xanthobacter sp. V4C-4]|uniref:ABC transporter ATP-binding protein n=1 Tax=Xanthobacter cornucopiae TaxID=3119924 RepID=UPI00372CC264
MSSDIVIEGLGKAYASRGGRPPAVIFDALDMRIEAGQLVALVGPSGCGKSTLLNLIAGLDTPDAGRIDFRGGASDSKLAMVFQQPRLVDWLTAEENVALVFEREGRRPPGDPREVVRALLRKVGLADQARAYPQFLSGGQRQRVAIARAFAVAPDILLLDEPFSALDELTARRLRLLLQNLWAEAEGQRPTGVLVTHNMLEAALLADRIFVLNGQPSGFAAVMDVDIPHPRDPEDPALFAIHRQVLHALGEA